MEDHKTLNIQKTELLLKMYEFPDKRWTLQELKESVQISERYLRKILNEFRNMQWIIVNTGFDDRRTVKVRLTELGIRRGTIAKLDMRIFGKKTLDEIDNIFFEAVSYLKKRKEKVEKNGNKTQA